MCDIQPEQYELLLQNDICMFTEQLLKLEWVANTPKDLDILWDSFKKTEWTKTEELRNKVAWLRSRIKFRPHLIGRKRERLRMEWFMENIKELFFHYLDEIIRYFWSPTSYYRKSGAEDVFLHFWDSFPLRDKQSFIEQTLDPLVLELTQDSLDKMWDRIKTVCDEYRLFTSTIFSEVFQLLPFPDFTNAKQIRKLGGKQKATIIAEKREKCNYLLKVLTVFINCIAVDQASSYLEILTEELIDHFKNSCSVARKRIAFSFAHSDSSFYKWKAAHPKEYSLFLNEASETILRAMYNHNHADNPHIVEFEPNYLNLSDFSVR